MSFVNVIPQAMLPLIQEHWIASLNHVQPDNKALAEGEFESHDESKLLRFVAETIVSGCIFKHSGEVDESASFEDYLESVPDLKTLLYTDTGAFEQSLRDLKTSDGVPVSEETKSLVITLWLYKQLANIYKNFVFNGSMSASLDAFRQISQSITALQILEEQKKSLSAVLMQPYILVEALDYLYEVYAKFLLAVDKTVVQNLREKFPEVEKNPANLSVYHGGKRSTNNVKGWCETHIAEAFFLKSLRQSIREILVYHTPSRGYAPLTWVYGLLVKSNPFTQLKHWSEQQEDTDDYKIAQSIMSSFIASDYWVQNLPSNMTDVERMTMFKRRVKNTEEELVPNATVRLKTEFEKLTNKFNVLPEYESITLAPTLVTLLRK